MTAGNVTTPGATRLTSACMPLGGLEGDEVLLERLSLAERERVRSMAAPRRREFAAARVLAKHVALDWLDGSAPPAFSNHGEAGLRRYSASRVCLGIPETFRNMELRRRPREGSAHWLVRNDERLGAPRLSLSHGAGWVAVAAWEAGSVGIDIAAIAPPAPAFLRAHFAESEHSWVQGADPRSFSVLYTLLWTLKEAVIKAGAAPGVTLWGYDELTPAIEMSAASVARDLGCTLGRDEPLTTTFPLRIGTRCGVAQVTRLRGALFSTVMLEPVIGTDSQPEERSI